MRLRARLLAGAVISVLALPTAGGSTAVASDATASAADQQRQFRVIQYNVTGAARPLNVQGSPANAGSLAALDYLKWEMANFPSAGGEIPDVVALQEVCRSQFNHLRATYAPDTNHTYAAFRTTVVSHRLCPNEEPLGEVLLSRWPLTDISSRQLKEPEPKQFPDEPDRWTQFHMLCADVNVTGARAVRTCTYHGWLNDAGQFRTMVNDLNPVVDGGKPVVIAGDLNNFPNSTTLDPVYRLDRQGGWQGAGRFNEADQNDSTWFHQAVLPCLPTACRVGERTTSGFDGDTYIDAWRKFDYIFFSRFNQTTGGFNALSADARPFVFTPTATTPYVSRSDHHLYRGQATLNY